MCNFYSVSPSITQAQMKTQDLDMSQRVENLSNSVQALWGNKQLPQPQITQSSSVCCLRAIRESRLETEVLKEISESSDSEEEDDQSFEDYIRSTLPLIGDRRVSNANSGTAEAPVVPACTVEIVIDCVADDGSTQHHCLLNSSPHDVNTQNAQGYSILNEQTNHQEWTKPKPLIATHQASTLTTVH